MGFLSLFKKDWPAELDRANSYLEDGEPVLALDLLRKIESRVDGDLQQRAKALKEQCETALFDSLIRRADESEAEGKLDDAADWLLAAIERATGEALQELEQRREKLLRMIEDGINPFGTDGDNSTTAEPNPAEDLEEDLEFTFEALLQTLVPSVAELYQGRSVQFQRAYVQLNAGQAETALEELQRLLQEDPEDPVLILERGRAHLLMGNNDSARADFDCAWNRFGDEPIDAAGTHSLPSFWAESTLAEDPQAVVARLAEIALPGRGSQYLSELYATALVQLGAAEESVSYLHSALRRFPGAQRFSFLLAEVLAAGGDTSEAIACLEAAVGPSCASGHCGVGPQHIPSVRLLASLYLGDAAGVERCGELMAIVAKSQGGMLGAKDHAILSRYFDLQGNEEAAEEAREEAERLTKLGPMAESGPTGLTGGQRRIL